MSSKVYVGNLPFSISEERLRELFSQFGSVASVKIITDETGRSKGFAFVEFASDDEAASAADNLNGTDLEGRNIKVEVARPQEFRPRGDRNGGDRGGDRRRTGGGDRGGYRGGR